MITEEQLQNIDKEMLFIEYQKVCSDLEKINTRYQLLKDMYMHNTKRLIEAQDQLIRNIKYSIN